MGQGAWKKIGMPTTLSLEKWHESPENAVMIGDRLSTDILCANRANITSVHVLTGIEEQNDGSILPDLTVADLSELFED